MHVNIARKAYLSLRAEYFVSLSKESLDYGNISAAIDTVTKALEHFPDNVNILVLANDVYRAAGNFSKSAFFAQKLIDLHPESWVGFARLIEYYILKEDYDAAFTAIDNSLKIHGNESRILNLRFGLDLKKNNPILLHHFKRYPIASFRIEDLLESSMPYDEGFLSSEFRSPSSSQAFTIAADSIITDCYGVYDSNGNPLADSHIWSGHQEVLTDFPMGGYYKIDISLIPSFTRVKTAI